MCIIYNYNYINVLQLHNVTIIVLCHKGCIQSKSSSVCSSCAMCLVKTAHYYIARQFLKFLIDRVFCSHLEYEDQHMDRVMVQQYILVHQ